MVTGLADRDGWKWSGLESCIAKRSGQQKDELRRLGLNVSKTADEKSESLKGFVELSKVSNHGKDVEPRLFHCPTPWIIAIPQ